jgi:hypothetical protein
MNKAFVREPEQTIERCPRCGSLGQPVNAITLDAQMRPESRNALGESAFFCPAESCPMAYFDAFDRSVTTADLVRPVFPKDPQAPICACFGVTCDEIEADVREGVATRTRNVIDRAKSPEARCSKMAANGQSCVSNVQRYFMKCRGGD